MPFETNGITYEGFIGSSRMHMLVSKNTLCEKRAMEAGDEPFGTYGQPSWSGDEEQLCRTLADAVRSGNITLTEVSSLLCISSRSLQRRLAQRGTTFGEQVKKVRMQIAEESLREGVLSTDEISSLVGYQNTVSFMRAFKQWTGMTVAEFRATEGRTS